MKITIIGGGTMGTIFKDALLKQKVFKKNDLTIVDKGDQTAPADVYLFAVKPQDFSKAAKRLKGTKNKLIISIMAGVTIAKMAKFLPGNKIIRSMPNLGAQASQSMTVWQSKNKLSPKEHAMIKKIFTSIGEEIEVKKEDLIDAATAVAGSGPGYIYFFADQMAKTAHQLGFSVKDATKLAKQTFKGSVQVWLESDSQASDLQKRVTSRKGTTEAGIQTLKKNKFANTLTKGIKAAYKQAKKLSKL